MENENKNEVIKKSRRRRFAEVFVQEDMGKVSDHIIFDIFVPAVKKLILDMFNNTLSSIFYGTGVPKGTPIQTTISRTNYSNATVNQQASTVSAKPSDESRLVVDSYDKAANALAKLTGYIKKYGYARCSDLYHEIGVSCPWTYNNYGWTDISTARIQAVDKGYLIIMPKALPIE